MKNMYDNLIDIQKQIDEVIEIMENEDEQELSSYHFRMCMFRLGLLKGRLDCQIQLMQPLPPSLKHDC